MMRYSCAYLKKKGRNVMLHIVEKMIEHVLKDLFALGELGDAGLER